MKEFVECPFCSCIIRRQKLETQAFMNRYISHMLTHLYSVEEE